ncbi:DUF6153 family protein [Actinoplanes oblitus]|uniref:DUF6153 family protein n=1 Tax=Actinoplanes oblitus TaxID=3040509 RepID=A0ABY8WL12_9ACTN|nr:DUF6153 family protein [Actinoplanes oblitus]WIM98591.1 DUF6153 family protein [Actinoplanes oblitus]
MIGTTAAAIGRLARTVLLLCTVFGLATMHTLGHAGVRGEHPGAPAMSAVQAAVPSITTGSMSSASAEACPDDHCTGHHHQMTVWSVCLAVLGGLAVVLLLAMALVAAARPYPGPRGHERTRRRPTRAPPGTRTGLTLASTAVLRI